MADISGTCDDRFAPVRDAFAKNFDDGLEVGASVAVVKDGEMVVDLWGGHVDEARTQPWEQDTIINVWSSTKTMSFLVALMLADAGELDLQAPVAKYWPEFAANGKEGDGRDGRPRCDRRLKHCLNLRRAADRRRGRRRRVISCR